MDAWIISSIIWIWLGITRLRYPPWRVYYYKKEGESVCLRGPPRREKGGEGGRSGERGAVYDSKVGEEREGVEGGREGGRDGGMMGLGKAEVDVEVGRGRVGECVSDWYNCLLWLMGADIQIGRATLELNGESLLMQILGM